MKHIGKRASGLARRGWAKLRQNSEHSSADGGDDGYSPTGSGCITLGALVEPLLKEMVANAMGEKSDLSAEEKKGLVAETAARLGEDERQAILREAGDPDLNRALWRSLSTGGVYGAVGGTVAVSGFAPYILAAQASAFIPLVSGPALVSMLAVLTNPVVIAAVVLGLGHRWARTANQHAAAQVAVHLIALLACDGVHRRRNALEQLVSSFTTIPELPDAAFKGGDVFALSPSRATTIPELPDAAFKGRTMRADYQNRWRELDSGSWLPSARPRPSIAEDWERADINRDSVGIASLSVGDLIYSLATIDPHVVAAADFSSSDEITDSIDFAANLLGRIDDQWSGRGSLEGLVDSQKGYLMEQLAATKLAADGHVVELPDAPNQPGWDMIVDGQPFQVKCLADSHGLASHFETYPDIPVLVNSDLIGGYENWPADWKDNVFFLEGYTNELVSHVTERSYLEAKDLADNDVPEIALVYVAARQAWKLKKGEVTAAHAASHLLIEGSTRVGLAVVGNVVGASIGVLLFGPAGGMVGAALTPVVAQSGAGLLSSRVAKAVGLRTKVEEEIDAKCEALSHAVNDAIDVMHAKLRLKHRLVGNGVAGIYVRHRLIDEARHLDECQGELQRLRDGRQTGRDRAASTLRVVTRSVHTSRCQAQIRDLFNVL